MAISEIPNKIYDSRLETLLEQEAIQERVELSSLLKFRMLYVGGFLQCESKLEENWGYPYFFTKPPYLL